MAGFFAGGIATAFVGVLHPHVYKQVCQSVGQVNPRVSVSGHCRSKSISTSYLGKDLLPALKTCGKPRATASTLGALLRQAHGAISETGGDE